MKLNKSESELLAFYSPLLIQHSFMVRKLRGSLTEKRGGSARLLHGTGVAPWKMACVSCLLFSQQVKLRNARPAVSFWSFSGLFTFTYSTYSRDGRRSYNRATCVLDPRSVGRSTLTERQTKIDPHSKQQVCARRSITSATSPLPPVASSHYMVSDIVILAPSRVPGSDPSTPRGQSSPRMAARPNPASMNLSRQHGSNRKLRIANSHSGDSLVARAASAEAPYKPLFRIVRMLNMELQMTDLLEACARGFPGDVSEMLDSIEESGEAAMTAELAAVDDWAGSSPLHWAAYANAAECIQLLLAAGASTDVLNAIDASTPLHLAGRYGSASATAALLAGGASVDLYNVRGNTPLHECCDGLALVVRTPGTTARTAEQLLLARAAVDAYQSVEAYQSQNAEREARGVRQLATPTRGGGTGSE